MKPLAAVLYLLLGSLALAADVDYEVRLATPEDVDVGAVPFLCAVARRADRGTTLECTLNPAMKFSDKFYTFQLRVLKRPLSADPRRAMDECLQPDLVARMDESKTTFARFSLQASEAPAAYVLVTFARHEHPNGTNFRVICVPVTLLIKKGG